MKNISQTRFWELKNSPQNLLLVKIEDIIRSVKVSTDNQRPSEALDVLYWSVRDIATKLGSRNVSVTIMLWSL